MHLKRDILIRQTIARNRQSPLFRPPAPPALLLLHQRALSQLTLSKVANKQIDYSPIELYLLLADQPQREVFYCRVRQDLSNLFRDEHAQKTVQTKWTPSLRHNIMAIFRRLAHDTYSSTTKTESNAVRREETSSVIRKEDSLASNGSGGNRGLLPLYVDTLQRLLTHEKLSRMEEKFLQPLLLASLQQEHGIEAILTRNQLEHLRKAAVSLSRVLSDREPPKSMSSNLFLKYCALRMLSVTLPHEKYLWNQLLHAPNPKYLLPLRGKGTFTALTNELLLKSNKLDMVACQYWHYYEYEEGDSYQRIRRAAEWGGMVDVLLLLVRAKLVRGLEKTLTLINEKLFYFSTKHLTEDGLNALMALAETAQHICRNRSPQQPLLEGALERVDLGQLFQHQLILKEARLRPFAVALLKLYLQLLALSPRKTLRVKLAGHLGLQVGRLLQSQDDPKFTAEVVQTLLEGLAGLSEEERGELLFAVVDWSTHEWESRQQLMLGHEIALISVHAVRLVGQLVGTFGFNDMSKAEFKVLKLQFYYILALNYKEAAYLEAKLQLARAPLDLHPSLSNNSVFSVLESRPICREAFLTHLASLYGEDALLPKLEHQGLLALIDEVVTYRIQQTKTMALQQQQEFCFFALLVGLLQQVERVQATGKLLRLVRDYFLKCIRAYLIEVETLRARDETRTQARRLITKDLGYLVESCVSANPTLAAFSWQVLQEYLLRVPEVAIYTEVLVVWAECLSILYRKSNEEYESKSQKLRGKLLTSGTPIPTQRKEILNRVAVLMGGLYGVLVRGHVIDGDYLGVRVQYLIRQNCKSASFGFGWKFLKHIITSFKEDRDFLSREVLTNNSCSWFVNQGYFHSQLQQLDPSKLLLDKYLVPLHAFLNKHDLLDHPLSSQALKKIMIAVEPQQETEFVTIPPHSSEGETARVVSELASLCLRIESVELGTGERQSQPSAREEQLQQLYSYVFDVISRVKMVYITKWNQAQVFSQILHVCSRFANYRLLEHILLKIVPFFYCLNEYNSKIVETLGELLHLVVTELNTVCPPQEEQPVPPDSTFHAPRSHFQPLLAYEEKEPQIPGSRHKVVTSHSRRVHSLKAMYGQLVKFFGSHIHVCIAKGFPLSMLLRVSSISFLLQPRVLPQLGLESVCRCLLSQLQLVNVLRSALEKGETTFDGAAVDNFYVRTMKSALLHFQRPDFGHDQLVSSIFHHKALKQRVNFLIQICDYLRNDDFHQLSNKKLPKRHEIYARQHRPVDQGQGRLPSKKIKTIMIEEEGRGRESGREDVLDNRRSEVEPRVSLTTLRYSLLYLVSEQVDKIKAYAYPALKSVNNPYSLAGKKGYIINSILEELLSFLTPRKGAKLLHNLLVIFGDRIEQPQALRLQLRQLLGTRPIYDYPSFLPLYVQAHLNSPQKLRELNYWQPPHIPILLQYLSQQYEGQPALQRYVTKVLAQLQAEQILFYLPQIFQALTLTSGRIILHFLLEYARKSACFAHQLVWLAKVESRQQQDPQNKAPRPQSVVQHLDRLQTLSKVLIRRTLSQFNREEKAFFGEVNDFYEQVTAISGKMKPAMPPSDKKDIIKEEAEKIRVPRSAYLPFNTNYQVIAIKEDSGTPMQSAAKCPFLLTFRCQPYSGPDAYFSERKAHRLMTKFTEESEEDLPQEEISKPMRSMSLRGSKLTLARPPSSPAASPEAQSILTQFKPKRKAEEREISCIFKVFDDIRQDCLALQVIRLFVEIFERHGLGLRLFPYRTLSNRTGPSLDIGGIIEVVPNCVSRDSIGKTNEQSLYQFFLSNFGAEHNTVFQTARQNFIRSQAAYSVVSYLLQVKDRHNGNIMLDKEQGWLVHIDFGFILEISPANNLRFERAAFKLTDEMIRIMGGSIDSEPFQLYLTLVIKGFLLARRYHLHIENMVALMVRSGLPCFLPKAISNLRLRFFLELSQIEAADQMRELVLSAADHWTTNWYDRIQWMQQKIYH